MFVYGWSVLGLRFGLLILSFYPVGSFVLKVEGDSARRVERGTNTTPPKLFKLC